MKIILESVLTCHFCKYEKKEIMKEDSCAYFYECTNCNKILKAQKKDCCVFCSYGSIVCPSKQGKLS